MTGKLIRALRLASAGLLLAWLIFGGFVTWSTSEWFLVAALLAAGHGATWIAVWLYDR